MIEEIDLYDYPTYCQSCYLTIREDERDEWDWRLYTITDGMRICSSCLRVLIRSLKEWEKEKDA